MTRRSVLFPVLAALVAFSLIGYPVMSQANPNPSITSGKMAHNVVFELTSSDPKAWERLMNNIENLEKALGQDATQVEVVSHGEGLQILLKRGPGRPEARMKALADRGVVFAACENTMRGMKVTAVDLVDYAHPVDSGVAEVVRKEEDGWSYISR